MRVCGAVVFAQRCEHARIRRVAWKSRICLGFFVGVVRFLHSGVGNDPCLKTNCRGLGEGVTSALRHSNLFEWISIEINGFYEEKDYGWAYSLVDSNCRIFKYFRRERVKNRKKEKRIKELKKKVEN